MAKTSGLGDAFYISGVDISGDVNSLSKISGGPAATQDMTDITQSAYARAGLARDGGIDFAVFLDTAANMAHSALAPSGSADDIVSYFRGTAVGNPAASCVAKQLNYDWTEGADKSLLGAVSVLANGFGLEWGIQHTAGKQTDTSATSSAGMDGGAATAFGAQLYVQFFSVVGTSVTVKIQDFTSDTPASYTDVTGLTTTAVTPGGAPQAQRVAIANNLTVRQWTRVVTVGTFTSAVFAVQLVRNPVAGIVF